MGKKKKKKNTLQKEFKSFTVKIFSVFLAVEKKETKNDFRSDCFEFSFFFCRKELIRILED